MLKLLDRTSVNYGIIL